MSPAQSLKVLLLIGLFLALYANLRLWYLSRQQARFSKIVMQQLRQASDEIQALKQSPAAPLSAHPMEPQVAVRRDEWTSASQFISFLQMSTDEQLHKAQKI